jgi:uncharacterized SAM-binding protein YcdF (DUF218 family)
MDLEVDKYAKIIYEYMLMHQDLVPMDAIIALGANDIRVADRTYEVWNAGFAPIIICTGGKAHENDINNTGWEKSEAEMFEDRLLSLGVPKKNIFLEKDAQSTGDNVKNVKKLLAEEDLQLNNFIVVGKPWNERRAYTTFKKQWPEVNIIMTSPQLSYNEYMNTGEVPKDVLLNVMVGDFQRIKEYPKLGFQIEQEIPEHVWEAYEKLVQIGYTKYLIKN